MGVLLVACSESDIDMASDITTMEEALQESEYAISLNATGDEIPVESRAAINANSYGAFTTNFNDTLGILALAVGTTPSFKGDVWSADLSWSTVDSKTGMMSGKPSNELCVYLNNDSAWVKYSNTQQTRSEIQFIQSGGRQSARYYPLGSFYRYNFYAYSPRVKTHNLYYEANRVTAFFTNLDGTQDVMQAYATPESGVPNREYAWSANYYRYSNQRDRYTDERVDTYNPSLHFSHKMMQLMFNITAGGLPIESYDENFTYIPDYMKSYDEAYNTRVMSISILNIPDTVQMIVADRNNPYTQGYITYSKSRTKQYFLREYKARRAITGQVTILPDSVMTPTCPQPYAPYNVDEQGKQIKDYLNKPRVTKLGCPADNQSLREGIILPVLTEEDRINNPYQLQIVLEYPAYSNNFYTLKQPILLESDPEKTFEQGHSYEMTLKIYGPQTVEQSAQKVQWVTVSQQDIWKYVGDKEGNNYKYITIPEEEEEENERNNGDPITQVN